MKKFLFLVVLILAGCAKQAEYGPKAPARYEVTDEDGILGNLRKLRDNVTHEEWLLYTDSNGTVVLRHTEGE
jgi:hypothetical protein